MYFFAATCFNSRGEESEFSNEASYQTPKGLTPVTDLHTNAVQLTMSIEKSENPEGPWSSFADVGTDITAPGFFRGKMSISAEHQVVETSPKKSIENKQKSSPKMPSI